MCPPTTASSVLQSETAAAAAPNSSSAKSDESEASSQDAGSVSEASDVFETLEDDEPSMKLPPHLRKQSARAGPGAGLEIRPTRQVGRFSVGPVLFGDFGGAPPSFERPIDAGHYL